MHSLKTCAWKWQNKYLLILIINSTIALNATINILINWTLELTGECAVQWWSWSRDVKREQFLIFPITSRISYNEATHRPFSLPSLHVGWPPLNFTNQSSDRLILDEVVDWWCINTSSSRAAWAAGPQLRITYWLDPVRALYIPLFSFKMFRPQGRNILFQSFFKHIPLILTRVTYSRFAHGLVAHVFVNNFQRGIWEQGAHIQPV